MADEADALVPLAACVGRGPDEIGRKGAVLARAAAHGLDTPGGLVLPSRHFWAALAASGVEAQARYLASAALRLDPRHTLDLAAAIHAALAGGPAARLACTHAEEVMRRLPHGRLACRSSAAMEDGASAAFPGVFVSRLGLTDADHLGQAILECWRSVFAPTAVRYLLRLGQEPIDLSMAVLVQPQVEAAWYGLFVSRDPVSGDPGAVVELTGAGPEALVGGAPAAVRARKTAQGWRVEPRRPAITPALDRLAALAGALTGIVPGDLDIEFALPGLDAAPVLLQCRPLTGARNGQAQAHGQAPGPILSGRPCAPGLATGLVAGPGDEAEPDTPLIALAERLTTTDYDLVFRSAGVIVVQDVSPLSHAAILCRELGVPLVCGAGDEARSLRGAWVAMDGGLGAIRPAVGPPKPLDPAPLRDKRVYVTDVELALQELVTGRPRPSRAADTRKGATDILALPLAPEEAEQIRRLHAGGRQPV